MLRSHIPFTQFPPMVTLYKAIVQYHNQNIDTDTVKTQNISISTKIPSVAFTATPTPLMPPTLTLEP